MFSDGTLHPADRYVKGEDGFAQAVWDKLGSLYVLALAVPSPCVQDDGALAPYVAPAPKAAAKAVLKRPVAAMDAVATEAPAVAAVVEAPAEVVAGAPPERRAPHRGAHRHCRPHELGVRATTHSEHGRRAGACAVRVLSHTVRAAESAVAPRNGAAALRAAVVARQTPPRVCPPSRPPACM